MNNKLMAELRSIKATSEEEALTRQLMWAQQNKARNEFLEQLNKSLDDKGLERGSKERSKTYSDTVVAYDKQQRMSGWK